MIASTSYVHNRRKLKANRWRGLLLVRWRHRPLGSKLRNEEGELVGYDDTDILVEEIAEVEHTVEEHNTVVGVRVDVVVHEVVMLDNGFGNT